MNNIIKYLCIVAVVFTVSIVLLPSSSAQRDNQSDQFGEPTVTDATKQQKSEELVSDEIVLPIDRQKQLKSGKIAVFVELTDAPTTQVYAAIMSDSSRSRDQKQAEARTATRLQADSIKQKQQQIAGRLTDSRIAAREIYRVQRALNGIAIEVDISKLEEIRRLPGVKSVTVIEPEYPTNATSTPFLGAPLVWGSSLNVGVNGMGVKGENIKIGIIDTGIDYQHAIFGGTGLLADYQAPEPNLRSFGRLLDNS